ncbi:MAG: NPCBM/NEW2 domain-containing protein, partial [Chthoniobacter sp.]
LYFSEWGFDFIKVDGCGLRAFPEASEKVRSGRYRALKPLLDLSAVSRSDIDAVKAIFEDINKALSHENPDGDFLLSLCIWGAADVRSWGKNMGNISRTSDDINPTWSRMLTNFDSTVTRALYAHPGSWNDPDMLFIGKGEFDSAHLTEAKSHFALWAITNAPLFMGTDLRTTPQSLMDVFGNSAIISINQDPGGHQAVVAYDSDDVQTLVKTLERGGKAVAILNRTAANTPVTLTADHLKFESNSDIVLTDLWSGKEHRFRDETTFMLAPHQTLIFRAQGSRKLPNGLYLSEQPGNVNPAVDGVRYPQADPGIHRSATSWAGTKGKGERPMYAGWGGAQADGAPFGQVLSISGKPIDTGLGILANSRFEVRNKGYRRFETLVGVDDSAGEKSSAVTFTIYGDGKLLASSSPLKWGAQAEKMSVNVAGVDIIELVARSAGAQNELLPVTWGEAALLK